MDKKVLVGVLDVIVKSVAEKAGITELEARAVVGIALRKGADKFVNAVVASVSGVEVAVS